MAKLTEAFVVRKTLDDLSPALMRSMLETIRRILWFDEDADEWNPDKEWDSSEIEEVAAVLAGNGLRPTSAAEEILGIRRMLSTELGRLKNSPRASLDGAVLEDAIKRIDALKLEDN